MGSERRRPIVLLLDDHPQLLCATARRLRLAGLDVVTAQNADALASLVETHAPDVVVSDVSMPTETGDILDDPAQFRAAVRETPVILYSARDEELLGDLASDLRARFVRKSDGIRALESAIAAAIGRSITPSPSDASPPRVSDSPEGRASTTPMSPRAATSESRPPEARPAMSSRPPP